ncbi:hypothetical protein C4K68_03580 [Pokkaliibacter plantistimulans]|uniref:EamA domain-containing protein n=1 Tax=Proteobacteria bacterium 228 TaxID=2083153 RepID=A0A2S5KVC6_9PROT|nr:DMT family transporter [Pokkaliibacter plantistimulans]PPC78602.1 hypothetical protein C4K68_03580 [Pokkaliibacter plantistimulans]
MSAWIGLTLFAALMQAARTGMQKQLSTRTSAMTTTLARYFYTLPLAWLYLSAVLHIRSVDFPQVQATFLTFAAMSAVAQILATVFMVKLFQQRNFAVGISYAKSEAIMVALLGALFFAEPLTLLGWLSVGAGAIGILLLSPRGDASGGMASRIAALLTSKSAAYGLATGVCFALSSLWLRQASLSLETDKVASAAMTLATMISIQCVLIVSYQAARTPAELRHMFSHWPLVLGVGITSMCGSIGWFTAMTLENPALVKTLGQVEFFFTLIIALRIFKESFSLREYLGMAAIIVSVVGVLNV